MANRLIEVNDLSVAFADNSVVEGVSFHIDEGETLALVGESGSGKTVSALSIPQLLPYPYADHPSGSIKLMGEELMGAGDTKLLAVRGSEISMIFQEPMTSLNPLHKIGRQVTELLVLNNVLDKGSASEKVRELFDLVGLDGSIRVDAYPHELSGGEKQRVTLARAIVKEPSLILADEPTGNLDPVAAFELVQLLETINNNGTTILMASHNYNLIKGRGRRIIELKDGLLRGS